MNVASGEVQQKIREPIKVLASFAAPMIRIYFFSWRSRTYKVESMNLFHLEKDGNTVRYHFAVSSEGNAYQLAFNPQTLEWQLEDLVALV